MTLHITDPEAVRIAQQLADLTGTPLDDAVKDALRKQLVREQDLADKLAAIRKIQDRVRALPILDNRTADEIIGYNEFGVPE